MTDDAPEWEPPDWFWDILESSDFILQILAGKLELLPRDQLRLFQENFEDAKGEVNPFYRDDLGDILVDCHSEDGAEDFSAWVVGRGRVFYREVRTQPRLVNQFLDMFRRHDEESPATGTFWSRTSHGKSTEATSIRATSPTRCTRTGSRPTWATTSNWGDLLHREQDHRRPRR